MRGRGLLALALLVPTVIIATQLYFAYRVEGMRVPFMAVFAVQFCHWEMWALAGPLVWRLEHRWPISRRTVGWHALFAIGMAILVLGGFLAAYHALIRFPMTDQWFTGLQRSLRSSIVFFTVSYFHVELMLYTAVVAAAYASRTAGILRARERDALKLEAELSGVRLKALRAQLQPHFLFNTLHTIGSLVLQRKNDQAVGLIAELGELLRETLANRDTELTPFEEELAYLRRYLRIEEARFGDRLSIEWQIDPASSACLIPPLILQPIVENAFRHGIARAPGDAVLRIASRVRNGSLEVTIDNSGPPLRGDEERAHQGYGLKNVSERLAARRPGGTITLSNIEAGVRAVLTLPLWERPAPSAVI